MTRPLTDGETCLATCPRHGVRCSLGVMHHVHRCGDHDWRKE